MKLVHDLLVFVAPLLLEWVKHSETEF
jgi:hypothetical protein